MTEMNPMGYQMTLNGDLIGVMRRYTVVLSVLLTVILVFTSGILPHKKIILKQQIHLQLKPKNFLCNPFNGNIPCIRTVSLETR
jgi:hypothetical protein